jgi:hypothetical protein
VGKNPRQAASSWFSTGYEQVFNNEYFPVTQILTGKAGDEIIIAMGNGALVER